MKHSSETPWEHVPTPDSGNSISSRRVDPEHPWNFFWAKSQSSHLLVLRHQQTVLNDRTLPRFQGFQVTNVPTNTGTQFLLMFEMLGMEHLELFQRLCTDIVASTVSSSDEQTAVETAIGRTWRWHHLLRGGRDDRLTIDEQRGLVGELLTIVDLLEPQIGLRAAIDAWTGPIGMPKDFELGRVAIEHKARRSAGRPEIRVNSEHQLDNADLERLYLVVRDVDQAPSETPGAYPLPHYIDQVAAMVGADQGLESEIGARLAAVGFRSTDDYSDTCWLGGKRRIYRIEDAFPRIGGSSLPAGVKDVSYTIQLKNISRYEVLPEQLEIPQHANQH